MYKGSNFSTSSPTLLSVSFVDHGHSNGCEVISHCGFCSYLLFSGAEHLFTYLFSSVTQSCLTIAAPWTAACQASLSITKSWSLLKLMCIELVMPSNHLILCHPLLLPPSLFPNIRVFSNESVLHIRQPKYWSFSFNLSPSNEYSGLISFRMDWFDLLAVQGTLKNLLQHHSTKASIQTHRSKEYNSVFQELEVEGNR